jgi:uncharacterized protein YdiU (UPF0061 family)
MRNARTFAAWQAYGFMHGVLNTDNISLLGLTIDFGPYACVAHPARLSAFAKVCPHRFMDVFDPNHVCNHSDDLGRYSYRMQPTMGVFAVTKLGDALAEVLGAEAESGAPLRAGWSVGKDQAQMRKWREKGLELVGGVKQDFTQAFADEYRRLMRKVRFHSSRIACLAQVAVQRLGITEPRDDDFAELFDPLLDLMAEHRLDFSHTFRALCDYDGANTDAVLDALQLGGSKRKAWSAFLGTYGPRIGASTAERKRANPRFILRQVRRRPCPSSLDLLRNFRAQWILEEAIARCEKEPDFLQRILAMATAPFEDYADGEAARLCGVGSEQMLGFQCSCSS